MGLVGFKEATTSIEHIAVGRRVARLHWQEGGTITSGGGRWYDYIGRKVAQLHREEGGTITSGGGCCLVSFYVFQLPPIRFAR